MPVGKNPRKTPNPFIWFSFQLSVFFFPYSLKDIPSVDLFNIEGGLGTTSLYHMPSAKQQSGRSILQRKHALKKQNNLLLTFQALQGIILTVFLMKSKGSLKMYFI